MSGCLLNGKGIHDTLEMGYIVERLKEYLRMGVGLINEPGLIGLVLVLCDGAMRGHLIASTNRRQYIY